MFLMNWSIFFFSSLHNLSGLLSRLRLRFLNNWLNLFAKKEFTLICQKVFLVMISESIACRGTSTGQTKLDDNVFPHFVVTNSLVASSLAYGFVKLT